jgi:hypothetical protein
VGFTSAGIIALALAANRPPSEPPAWMLARHGAAATTALDGCARRGCHPPTQPPGELKHLFESVKPETFVYHLAGQLSEHTAGTPLGTVAGLVASQRLTLSLRPGRFQIGLRF